MEFELTALEVVETAVLERIEAMLTMLLLLRLGIQRVFAVVVLLPLFYF